MTRGNAEWQLIPARFSAYLQRFGARLELCPTERCAILRFTFSQGTAAGRVIVELPGAAGTALRIVRARDGAPIGVDGTSAATSGGASPGFGCHLAARFCAAELASARVRAVGCGVWRQGEAPQPPGVSSLASREAAERGEQRAAMPHGAEADGEPLFVARVRRKIGAAPADAADAADATGADWRWVVAKARSGLGGANFATAEGAESCASSGYELLRVDGGAFEWRPGRRGDRVPRGALAVGDGGAQRGGAASNAAGGRSAASGEPRIYVGRALCGGGSHPGSIVVRRRSSRS